MLHIRRVLTLAAVALGGLAPACQAIITYWSPLPATFEPKSCYYADSGWQYQGQWSSYLGTAIAPQYFVTAKHVGGSVGGTFTYGGQAYTTIASYASPASDLRIWQVDGTFDAWAPLYTGSREVGETMVVFGRGVKRGSPVVVGGQTKGWYWGAADHSQTWGSNTVSEIVNFGGTYGQTLSWDFDATGDFYEGTLADGDSGGGVFIQAPNGQWQLAGINLAVDGPYSLTGQPGSGFSGAIFDTGGLYVGGDGNWTYVNDTGQDKPASAYATRISANRTWIESVIGQSPLVPEPASVLLMVTGLAAAMPWRGRRTAAPRARHVRRICTRQAHGLYVWHLLSSAGDMRHGDADIDAGGDATAGAVAECGEGGAARSGCAAGGVGDGAAGLADLRLCRGRDRAVGGDRVFHRRHPRFDRRNPLCAPNRRIALLPGLRLGPP